MGEDKSEPVASIERATIGSSPPGEPEHPKPRGELAAEPAKCPEPTAALESILANAKHDAAAAARVPSPTPGSTIKYAAPAKPARVKTSGTAQLARPAIGEHDPGANRAAAHAAPEPGPVHAKHRADSAAIRSAQSPTAAAPTRAALRQAAPEPAAGHSTNDLAIVEPEAVSGWPAARPEPIQQPGCNVDALAAPHAVAKRPWHSSWRQSASSVQSGQLGRPRSGKCCRRFCSTATDLNAV